MKANGIIIDESVYVLASRVSHAIRISERGVALASFWFNYLQASCVKIHPYKLFILDCEYFSIFVAKSGKTV